MMDGSTTNLTQIVAELETFRADYLPRSLGLHAALWSDRLAIRRLVESEMPAIIHYAQHEAFTAVWYVLGERRPTWILQSDEVPVWIAESMAKPDQAMGGSGPSLVNHTTVYAIGYQGSLPSLFSQDVLDFLAQKADAQVRQWMMGEVNQWSRLGHRDWHISYFPADAPPCAEMAAVTRLQPGGSLVVTTEDLVEVVGRVKLLEVVPKAVWEVFNRAAKLWVFGYLDWEFFTMAQHYAVMALETSLKELYMARRSQPLTLTVRPLDEHGKSYQEQIIRKRLCTYHALAREVDKIRRTQKFEPRPRHIHILVDREPFPAKKTDLADWAVRKGWLSVNERCVLDIYFRRRNRWSHPEGTSTDWIGQVHTTLTNCSVLINRMWERVMVPKGALWEPSYVDPPSWAQI